MTLSQLKAQLAYFPVQPLSIDLPDGETVPAHFHGTEVAFARKDFIDYGGTIRHEGNCLLQIWVADDYDHRVSSTTLAKTLEHCAPVIPTEALPVEVEYSIPGLTYLTLDELSSRKDGLHLTLSRKQTNCLAKDV